MFMVCDRILMEVKNRFSTTLAVTKTFSILTTDLLGMTAKEIKNKSETLSEDFPPDFDTDDLTNELLGFKFVMSEIMKKLERRSDKTTTTDNCEPRHPPSVLTMYQQFCDLDLADVYPNLNTAFRIFLTLPVTVASCERSFSKLKLIKNYLRTTMKQDRLTNLAILSIEKSMAKHVDFNSIINKFANMKSRRISF